MTNTIDYDSGSNDNTDCKEMPMISSTDPHAPWFSGLSRQSILRSLTGAQQRHPSYPYFSRGADG